jgi:hypothetical protein
VAAGVADGRGADAPRTIHRPVQQLGPAAPHLLGHRVDVVHLERELKSDTAVSRCNGGRRDKRRRFTRLERVDERLSELEDGRVVVFEGDRQPEDVCVEALRLRQILDEQRDRGDPSGPCRRRNVGFLRLAHFGSPLIVLTHARPCTRV